LGPAARVGDLVQITRVDIDKDRIVLEINNGMKGKRNWKDHVQVGIGYGTVPLNQNPTNAPSGTSIVMLFGDSIGDVSAADVKKLIKPVLDFEKHSATENYVDTLPPEIKTAIEQKKPVEGMDRDQVLLALGRPVRKTTSTSIWLKPRRRWISSPSMATTMPEAGIPPPTTPLLCLTHVRIPILAKASTSMTLSRPT
jgi:hypothetical protein